MVFHIWFIHRIASHSKTHITEMAIINNNDIINNNNNGIKTYRHEFGKEFMERLSAFSKVHQFDDRHMYKSEWTKWTQQEEIAEAIDAEKRRLSENGYTGDIDDKMFKAGRYYFRKKTATAEVKTPMTPKTPTTPTTETAAPPPSQQQSRRPYITMSKDTIATMDDHIKIMHSTQTQTSIFKPSSCYDNFYQTKMSTTEMTREIEKIIEKYQKFTDTSRSSPDEVTTEIIDKIKKTYKNRYYKFVSSHTEQ
jgi:hypothetical protein